MPSASVEKLPTGALLDHGTRTSVELDVDTIMLAVEYGFTVPARDEATYELLASSGERGDPEDLSDEDLASACETLSEIAYEAIDYLSEYAAPEHYYVDHDGEVGALVCAPATIDIVELAETYTEDENGETVEGTHGIITAEGDYSTVPERVYGNPNEHKRWISSGRVPIQLEDLEDYGPMDYVDDRREDGEIIAYLADIESVGPDDPYVRAILLYTDGDAQHDAALERMRRFP